MKIDRKKLIIFLAVLGAVVAVFLAWFLFRKTYVSVIVENKPTDSAQTQQERLASKEEMLARARQATDISFELSRCDELSSYCNGGVWANNFFQASKYWDKLYELPFIVSPKIEAPLISNYLD